MTELALGNPRMLLAAGVASLHQDHYLIVRQRAIKNPSRARERKPIVNLKKLVCDDAGNRQVKVAKEHMQR